MKEFMKFLGKWSIYCLFGLFFWAMPQQGNAQEKTPITAADYENQQIEMADQMRADGKIYIVVATICSLLGGMFIYLILLDQRVRKIEKLTEFYKDKVA
jgi:uncharacterized membrane protein